MNKKKMMNIFRQTAYVRTGGSAEELRCAEYLVQLCKEMGKDATIESFPVQMANMQEATLTVDGKTIPCKGYLCAGNAQVEAGRYILGTQGGLLSIQSNGKF